MLEKYRATIHGDRIEWEGKEPAELNTHGRLTVDVMVVDRAASAKKSDSKLAVAALRKIAERGGITSIPDPVKWQREIRKDRPLPGR